MKSTIQLTVASIFTCLVINLQAQLAVVTATGGDVQYSDGTAWKKAITGTKLMSDQQIKLNGAGYAALVVNGSRSFEIKSPGTYKISELAKAHPTNNQVASKYYEPLIRASQNSGNNQKYTGAVERAIGVAIISPNFSKVADDIITLVWQPVKTSSYIFELLDERRTVIHTATTTEPTLVLNLTQIPNIKTGTLYNWRIMPKDLPLMKSDEMVIQILSAQERARLDESAKQIMQLTGGNTSAMSQAVLASFYAESESNFRAMQSYKEALRLAPEAETYKDMYATFLNKVGLELDPSQK